MDKARESESFYDIVITWVDYQDKEWADDRKKNWQRTEDSIESDNQRNRYVDFQNLRYILRSIATNLKNYRNIYIVTVNPLPDYIVESDDLIVISHSDIFADQSLLPTFNSNAIESCLHRIPGLAERYVYFNDDIFASRKQTYSDFFRDRKCLYWTEKLSSIDVLDEENGHHAAAANSFALLDKRFGPNRYLFLAHKPQPFIKSLMADLETAFQRELAISRRQKFRGNADLAVTAALAPYYLAEQGAATFEKPPLFNIDTYIGSDSRLSWLPRFFRLCGLQSNYFCIYDQQTWTRSNYEKVVDFLDWNFPEPSKYERNR